LSTSEIIRDRTSMDVKMVRKMRMVKNVESRKVLIRDVVVN
jgi:hypothetical protein